MAELHRLERHGFDVPYGNYVRLSFDIDNRGYFQIKCTEAGLREIDIEPPLHSLKKRDQQDITEIATAVYYFTFGEMPDTFK